jgi:hypothetical protein
MKTAHKKDDEWAVEPVRPELDRLAEGFALLLLRHLLDLETQRVGAQNVSERSIQ